MAVKEVEKKTKGRSGKQLTKEQSIALGQGANRRSDPVRQISKHKSTDKEQGADQEVKKKEQNFTTCIFIPEHRLYLIPFYDFYRVRFVAKNKPEFEQLRKHGRITEYLKKMRQFNRSVKKAD